MNKTKIFEKAIRKNDFNTVSRFLKDYSFLKANAYNNFLRRPAKRGQIEMVKLLLEDNFLIRKDQVNLAINVASGKGHTDLVKLLLADLRVDYLDLNLHQSLAFSSEHGHIDVVNILIADERVDYSFCNSAVDKAYEEDQFCVLKVLLENKIIEKKIKEEDLELYNEITLCLIQNKINIF